MGKNNKRQFVVGCRGLRDGSKARKLERRACFVARDEDGDVVVLGAATDSIKRRQWRKETQLECVCRYLIPITDAHF
jgi:hypothetical protein